MSSIVNKAKAAMSPSSSAPEGTHGPHGSRVANSTDPRVDSDMDHRANPLSSTGGGYTSSNNYAAGTTAGTHHGMAGTHNTTLGHTGGPAPTTEGPHKSDMANKLDPRADSDRDGRTMGNMDGASNFTSNREGAHGPHSSNLMNSADPRVDSDRDGSRTVGQTYGGSGTHGTHTATGTGHHTGPTSGHHTGVTGGHHTGATGAMGTAANPAHTHHNTTTTGTHGHDALPGQHTSTLNQGLGAGGMPGPAPNTAGPHKSDMMNKLDPRVDSDLNGSKTVGGNKTYTA